MECLCVGPICFSAGDLRVVAQEAALKETGNSKLRPFYGLATKLARFSRRRNCGAGLASKVAGIAPRSGAARP